MKKNIDRGDITVYVSSTKTPLNRGYNFHIHYKDKKIFVQECKNTKELSDHLSTVINTIDVMFQIFEIEDKVYKNPLYDVCEKWGLFINTVSVDEKSIYLKLSKKNFIITYNSDSKNKFSTSFIENFYNRDYEYSELEKKSVEELYSDLNKIEITKEMIDDYLKRKNIV